MFLWKNLKQKLHFLIQIHVFSVIGSQIWLADTQAMGSALGMANSFTNIACLWIKVCFLFLFSFSHILEVVRKLMYEFVANWGCTGSNSYLKSCVNKMTWSLVFFFPGNDTLAVPWKCLDNKLKCLRVQE